MNNHVRSNRVVRGSTPQLDNSEYLAAAMPSGEMDRLIVSLAIKSAEGKESRARSFRALKWSFIDCRET